MISSAVEPHKSAGQTFAAMRHHRDKIDIVVAHSFRDLRSRFACHDYRFNFKAIEKWISQEFAHFSSKLQ